MGAKTGRMRLLSGTKGEIFGYQLLAAGDGLLSGQINMKTAAATLWAGVDQIMAAWALEQIAPWLLRDDRPVEISDELARLNASVPYVYLFEISQGCARLLAKPEEYRGQGYDLGLGRAQLYQSWLTDVTAELCPDLTTTIAIYVNDAALSDPRVPVFSFQKPQGNLSLLLPDVDLLWNQFEVLEDENKYFEKKPRAVFAGSTSGGFITVSSILENRPIPRIRAAVFFRGNEDVIFKLPVVVQHEGEHVVDLLRSLDVGVGERMSWPEQLKYRFLLSMDGNGATCLRVAAGLASNSVLVKYESRHQLYYFSGLQPWAHFLPVTSGITGIIQERWQEAW